MQISVPRFNAMPTPGENFKFNKAMRYKCKNILINERSRTCSYSGEVSSFARERKYDNISAKELMKFEVGVFCCLVL